MSARPRRDPVERAAARLRSKAASRELLVGGERWADEWLEALVTLDVDERAGWESLLRLAAVATQPRSTPEWRAAGRAAIDAVGVGALRAAAVDALARLAGTCPLSPDDAAEHVAIAEGNANVLRGVVWLLMLDPWPELPAFLGALCTTCMKPVRDVGPRAQRVANACIASLGALAASPDSALRAHAVAHVVQAREDIHDRATRVALSTALASAAAALGVSLYELEASTVP